MPEQAGRAILNCASTGLQEAAAALEYDQVLQTLDFETAHDPFAGAGSVAYLMQGDGSAGDRRSTS